MKTLFAIFSILVLIPVLTRGQTDESLLYNNKGQFRKDTSLTITPVQLTKWKRIEQDFINQMLHDVIFSQFAIENYTSGTSVISFEVDKSGKMTDFNIIKKVGGGLEEIIKNAINSFNMLTSIAPAGTKNFRYYLAFDFQLIDAKNYIEKENAIPITKARFILIQK